MKRRILRRERAIYLIGRDVMEAMRVTLLAIQPERSRRLEQHMSAHDIGSHEFVGAQN